MTVNYLALNMIMRDWAQKLWLIQNPHGTDIDASNFLLHHRNNPHSYENNKGNYEMFYFVGLAHMPKIFQDQNRLVGKFMEHAFSKPLRRSLHHSMTKWVAVEVEKMIHDIEKDKGIDPVVDAYPLDSLHGPVPVTVINKTMSDLKILPSYLMMKAFAEVRKRQPITIDLTATVIPPQTPLALG